MRQQQTQKQLQRLSPQQLLLTRLVQLNQADLNASIREELEKNPILEVDDIRDEPSPEQPQEDPFEYRAYLPSGKTDMPEIIQADEPDSLERLMEQIHLSGFEEKEIKVAEEIVGSLDESGFLTAAPLVNIAYKLDVDEEFAQKVLKRVQAIAEPGMAARDLQECMLIQMKYIHEEPYVIEMVSDHFDRVMDNDMEYIQKEMDLNDEEIDYARMVISSLNPKPGQGKEGIEKSSIVPDIFLVEKDNSFYVALNESDSQNLRLSDKYLQMLESDSTDKPTRSYLQKHKQSADWFVNAVQQRKQSMLLVARAMVNRQKIFFKGDESYPRPMILKDIAEDTQLDMSTISRIVNGKYIQTPDGIYELKYFFGEGVRRKDGSSVSAMKLEEDMLHLVAEENKNKPYTDEQISDLLVEQGYEIARRTISKYREKLGIPASKDRKEQKGTK